MSHRVAIVHITAVVTLLLLLFSTTAVVTAAFPDASHPQRVEEAVQQGTDERQTKIEEFTLRLREVARKLEDLHGMDHRGMTVAQVADSPSMSPQCLADGASLISDGCLSLEMLKSGLSPNGFASLCGSKCYASIVEFFTKCITLPRDAGTPMGSILKLACTRMDGELCGITLTRASGCGNFTRNETGCLSAPGNCVYQKSRGTCQAPPSAICHPCLQKMLRIGLSVTGEPDSPLAKFSDFMCYKAPNGKYCLDIFSDEDKTEFGRNYSEARLNAVCSNLSQRVCYAKLAAGAGRIQEYTATQTYRQCLRLAFTTHAKQTCVNAWRLMMYQSWTFSRATDIMCLANQAGKHCSRVTAESPKNFTKCFAEVSSQKKCSSTCDEVANHTVGDLGCCVGFFAELKSAILPAEFSVMRPPGHLPSGVTPTPPKKGAHVNPLAAFEVCPSTKHINETLDETCPILRSGLKTVRKLGLRIRWSYLLANETLLSLVNGTLMEDLLTTIGISSEDMTHFHVSKDTSVKIVDPTSGSGSTGSSGSGAVGGRYFSIAAAADGDEDTSGVQVEVGFATTSDEYTTGLTDSFDRSINDDTVSLTATKDALSSDCPKCAAGDDGQLIASSNSPGNDNGGSSVGMIVGIVVGAVAVVAVVGAIVIVKIRKSKAADGEYGKI